MSDEELQTLTRRIYDDDPTSKLPLEAYWRRLGLSIPQEYVKLGRGWNGRRLLWNDKGNMAAEGEEAVYRWLSAPMANLAIELVYVPGGEMSCFKCEGRGFTTTARIHRPQKRCKLCEETGKLIVEPFYIGRYPVTRREWWHNLPKRVENEHAEGTEFVPATGMTLANAKQFVRNLGLRLPTQKEWMFAALGGPIVPCLREGCVASGRAGYIEIDPVTKKMTTRTDCLTCHGTGVALRYNPWGNEHANFERCVYATTEPAAVAYRLAVGDRCNSGRFQGAAPQLARCQGRFVRRKLTKGPRGLGILTCDYCGTHPGYDTIENEGKIIPARPKGASHFGAFDMAGNVWELLEAFERFSKPLAAGGAYDAAIPLEWYRKPERVQAEEPNVGLRVALSVT